MKTKTQYICSACGYVGDGVCKNKGNGCIEIILWFFILIPGIIYSIWSRSRKPKLCAKCGQATLIPTDSPMGKKLLDETGQQVVEGASNGSTSKLPVIILILVISFFLFYLLMLLFGSL